MALLVEAVETQLHVSCISYVHSVYFIFGPFGIVGCMLPIHKCAGSSKQEEMSG
jgi:hypothetical protein